MATFWDRFFQKVDASGDCWEWTAGLNADGYGQFTPSPLGRLAHRVAWQLLVGEIPPGIQLDHRCFRECCVNPDHLEPVTPLVNNNRKRWGAERANSAKTHCPKGHPYGGDNLILGRPQTGTQWRRICRQCQHDRNARLRKVVV